MSKSTLFALVCFLLVSIAVGDYHARGYRSLRRRDVVQPKTASQVCVSEGHDAACADVSRNICKSLTCWGPDGVLAFLGKAPDGMWCANGHVCDNGECFEAENIATPIKNLELVECSLLRTR